MGLFGFGEEKKAAKKEPVWVAPTTGNEYYEGEDLPHEIDPLIYGNNDDYLDRYYPAHTNANRKANKEIDEMYKMIKTLIEQNTKLQEKVDKLEVELHCISDKER